MHQVKATPNPGRRVRKENGELLKPKGEAVERTSFWLRRKKDGDVMLDEIDAPAAHAEPAAGDTTAKSKTAAK